jgi:hypothetical protein
MSETEGKAPEAKKRRPKRKASHAGAVKVEPVHAESKEATASSSARSPGPFRGKCLYQSRKCENERAVKRNGKPHNLCDEHRSKQNQHQRKFDAKKFSRKRPRGRTSDEDTTQDESDSKAKTQRTEDEPSAKHRRTVTKQEAEARTASRVTSQEQSTATAGRGLYPPIYNAAPMPLLPPIQSPRGPILPPSPALVYAHTTPRAVPGPLEAYPRGHVGYGGALMQPPHVRRPYLQQDHRVQVSAGYSQSELVAARILAQPAPSPSSAVPVSTLVYYHTERQAAGLPRDYRPLSATPRMLPSLLVSPSAGQTPYFRRSEMMPSPAQRFTMTPAGAVALNSPARAMGTILPPLVALGPRRSSTATPSVSKQEQSVSK